MILGIGIDTVRVSEMKRLCNEVFVTHTFTEEERTFAKKRKNAAEAYAGMFAVREAVTKAVCMLSPDDWPGLLHIEVVHDEHGAPHVGNVPPLSDYLAKTGVGSVLVSITNEGDLATAIALAQTDALDGGQ
jgi:holo-[acyl-carrier protein] synthase